MAKKTWLQRIEINPEIMLGRPVIRGTRIPVEMIVRKLAQKITPKDILRDYPKLTEQDIQAALFYAAEVLSEERGNLGSCQPRESHSHNRGRRIDEFLGAVK